jgi:hypothetical protein
MTTRHCYRRWKANCLSPISSCGVSALALKVKERLHSALGYITPEQAERQAAWGEGHAPTSHGSLPWAPKSKH